MVTLRRALMFRPADGVVTVREFKDGYFTYEQRMQTTVMKDHAARCAAMPPPPPPPT